MLFHRQGPPPPSLRTAERVPVPAPPYLALAAIYDHLMWHVDYDGWARYLLAIADKFTVPTGWWCEGGCGTGSIAMRIAQHKHRICGFDLVPAMAGAATQKAQYAGLFIPYFTGDFRAMPVRAIAYFLAIYDSVNYLTEATDLHQFLAETFRVLLAGGLCVFDLCTERNSIRNLDNWYDSRYRNGSRYRRHSWYDKPSRMHHNDFEVVFDDQPATVYLEHHRQYIYRVEEVVAMVQRAGFRISGVFADLTFSAGSEKNDRVHLVLRKPQE